MSLFEPNAPFNQFLVDPRSKTLFDNYTKAFESCSLPIEKILLLQEWTQNATRFAKEHYAWKQQPYPNVIEFYYNYGKNLFDELMTAKGITNQPNTPLVAKYITKIGEIVFHLLDLMSVRQDDHPVKEIIIHGIATYHLRLNLMGYTYAFDTVPHLQTAENADELMENQMAMQQMMQAWMTDKDNQSDLGKENAKMAQGDKTEKGKD